MVSWPRSQFFPASQFDEELLGDVDSQYPHLFEDDLSEVPVRFASPSPVVPPRVEPGPEVDVQGGPRWTCLRCSSTHSVWSVVHGQWTCMDCGASKFYDATESFQSATEHGLWVYMPHTGPTAQHVDHRPQARPAVRRTLRHSPGSNPPEVFHEASEQPESENLTHDPSVDPETLEVLPRRRRRRRRGAGNAQPSNGEVAVVDTASPSRRPMTVPPMAQQQDVSNEPTNEILTALRQLLDERKKRSTGSDASWNSRQGPEKHVKWRGGAAPSPPAWKPQANDLRAFARWERRIEIWRLQVVAYMPPQDAALMLLTSLTGEAELEVEHLDLQKVHHRNGIQYILDTLREPLQQKQLFQKRTLLDSFEKLSRFPNESLRQYINRYRRVEKDLEAIGISSSNMYDSESKGNRLLERARLAPDLQRLVMIAAGNSLEYERIQEALNLQFPDFKPAPAVFQRERDNASRPPPSGTGSAFSSSSSTAASTWSSASSRPSSKGFGKHHPKRAFVAEQADELGDIPEQPEDEEPVDDDGSYEAEEEPAEATVDNDNTEDAPESEIQDAVAQLADVLTVTSKKLQSTVLGRKFTGRPRTIDDRKRTSTCSACGRVGHWHGDAICPQSGSSSQGHDNKGRGKSNSDGKGKGQQHRGSSSTSQPTKQAFMVRFPDSDEPEKDFDHHTSYFSYTTFFLGNQPTTTFVTEVIDFSGTMILDTACQRACCGNYWLSLHSKILSHHRLTVKNVETTDLFQFGSGGPKRSTCRAYLPASLPGQETQGLLLGVNVLDADIPFLASNTMLQKLGCVIDTAQCIVVFTVLGVTLPLHFKHGHWAVSISSFPSKVHQDVCWKELSRAHVWHDPDPEVVLSRAFLERESKQFDHRPASPSHARSSTRMDASLAIPRDESHDAGVPSFASDGSPCEVWFEATPLDDGLGVGGAEEGPCQGHGTSDQDHTASANVDMHPSGVPPLRQQARELRPVQKVHGQVPVESRRGRMASTGRGLILAIYTLAATLLGQHHLSGARFGRHPVQAGSPGQVDTQSQGEEQEVRNILERFEHLSDHEGQWKGQELGADHPPSSARRSSRVDPGGMGSSLGADSGRLPPERCDHAGLRRSRPVPGRSGHSEVCGSPFPLKDDHWEVKQGLCIRHHLTPRCHYFDLQHCPCPVPLQRLEPVCTAEMEFPDGNYGTYTYEWKSSQPPNPVQWTGRTVFTIITQFNKNSLTSVKNRRKLLDEVRRALRVYEIEYVAMDGLREKRPVSQVDVFEVLDTSCDLLETFAGQANITRRAKTFGLKAIEPVDYSDYSTGFDLSLIPDQQRVSSMIDRFKPLILIQGVDCKDWTLLQDNVNYLHRHIQLLKRRARARKILVQVAEWCVKQSQQGRYWLIENPLTSRLWQEPYILRLRDLPGTEEAICHAGAYGATNSKGQPIRKAHRFLGNCAPVLQRLQRRLSPEEQRACVPLEGRDTTLSAVYPPEMVKAILLGVRELAQQDDQHRFQRLGHRQTSFKVQMVHFTNSVENWLPAFEMADETFSRTSQRNYLVPHSHPLWAKVHDLVGWSQLERIQLTVQPVVHRLPVHVPHTHRGWALRFADGTYDISCEDLSDVHHPRGRFPKAVQLGIFFYGYGSADDPAPQEAEPLANPQPGHDQRPDEVQPPTDDDPRRQIQLTPPHGISFKPGIRINAEMKQMLSRVHRNMGHPSPGELKNMLAMSGARDPNLMAAIDGMTCDTCERTRMPPRPPLAHPPRDGYQQFGDALQMDIVYCRDTAGANFPVLGVICETTHLHTATVLESRAPEETFRKFMLCWGKPYGLPLTIRTDPDGAFRGQEHGQFEAELSALGVFIDYCPPEAHHRLGLIERQ